VSNGLCVSQLGKYTQRYVRCYDNGEECKAVPVLARDLAKRFVDLWKALPAGGQKAESKKAYLRNMRAALDELLSMAAKAEADGQRWVKAPIGLDVGNIEEAKVEFAQRTLGAVQGGLRR